MGWQHRVDPGCWAVIVGVVFVEAIIRVTRGRGGGRTTTRPVAKGECHQANSVAIRRVRGQKQNDLSISIDNPEALSMSVYVCLHISISILVWICCKGLINCRHGFLATSSPNVKNGT